MEQIKMMEKTDIRSLSLEELKAWFKEQGEKPFRAGQLYQWMHQKLAGGFDEMTNLSKSLREKLAEETEYTVLKPVEILTSEIDGTQKYLFELKDGNVIESVLMKYHHGNSVCISSQVGCRMGCRFCASTIGGKKRDLTVSEMLEEVYEIQKISGERVSNLVLMGTGEPLDNYDNVRKFIQLLTDENGLHISQRNVTLSTCGIVPNIRRLADDELSEVMDACRYYHDKTGRRLTFEYSLVGGVNDHAEDARELADLLKGLNGHVNLIPVNPIKERDFVQPSSSVTQAFKNKLEKYGINVTIRREMGRDINGACGQLRRSYMEKNKGEEEI